MTFRAQFIQGSKITLIVLTIAACGILSMAAVPQEAGEPPADEAPPVVEEAQADAPEEEQPIKEIKLYVEEWKWTPSIIRVKQGTLLKIEALSYGASRRFDLRAYRLKVPLPQDKPVKFEFLADKKGEFPWKCGRPCGNGCAKLRGKLVVE